jgi:Alpha/beta hydrolase domain
MEIRAPLGTNTGWNVRALGFRKPNLCSLSGAYIPFATTEEEPLANGDSRESLEERYGNKAGFVSAVRRATQQLLRQGFLLLEDANTFISAAEDSDVLK